MLSINHLSIFEIEKYAKQRDEKLSAVILNNNLPLHSLYFDSNSEPL